MSERNSVAASAAARVFCQQPERIATAWRRVLSTQLSRRHLPCNLLDPLVEPFIREVGFTLAGAHGSPWSRTMGVLRVSLERGTKALYQEFSALRRCLEDAVDVLGGSDADRDLIRRCVDEALDSAVALQNRLVDPVAAEPSVPFGGLVVEFFERAQGGRAIVSPELPAALH